MKKIRLCIFLLVVHIFAVSMFGSIGAASLPVWADGAQTKLGWEFVDPMDPGTSQPLAGWDKWVGGGAAPIWDFNPKRAVYGMPGQWHIQIPNVNNNNPQKHFWMSYVYGFDSNFVGNRIFTNIDGDFTSADFVSSNDEWFDINGNITNDHTQAVYGRFTVEWIMYPNPSYEDIWIGVLGQGPGLTEAYIVTRCIPSPSALLLAGMGMALVRKIRTRTN